MKLSYLGMGIGIVLLPAMASSGGLGVVEKPASVSGYLEDQAKVVKKGVDGVRFSKF